MYELAPFALPAGYGEAILSLADVKAHLSIEATETEFDDLVAAFRDAAVQMVEHYTGLILAPRVGMVWTAEAMPPRLRIGVRPVTAITAFSYLDGDGAEQAVNVEALRIGLRSEVLLKAGQSWPSGLGSGLAITFNAGLADGEAPPVLLQAARMFAAHLFANRETVVASGSIGGEVPFGFRQLCSPYRPVLL